jgi:phage gp36-like protein
MAYATINNVFKQYRPINTLIGFDDNQITSVDISSIFIAQAESFADAFLSRRYAVPLNPVPYFITQLVTDLSIFNMLVEKLPETPDFFQSRYDRSMEILKMLRDGEMDISSQTLVSTGDQEAWSSTDDYHPVFSPVLDPKDQAVDSDQVAADKSDRTDDV